MEPRNHDLNHNAPLTTGSSNGQGYAGPSANGITNQKIHESKRQIAARAKLDQLNRINQKPARNLFKKGDLLRMTTNQTGDIFHIMGALVHNENLIINTIYDPNIAGDKEKATAFANTYNAIWDINKSDTDESNNKAFVLDNSHTDGNGLGRSTDMIASAYHHYAAQNKGDEFFRLNKEYLTDKSVTDDSIIDFIKNLTNNKLDLNNSRNKILLIWSRFSGKELGHNPAGDSSKTGNKQLIELANRMGMTPVTIGHDSLSARNGDLGSTAHAPIHLGEFWSSQLPSNPFRGKDRRAQLNFYKLLAERCEVVQIGQKTGGMDGAYLVGVKTIEMEDALSETQARMDKWGGLPSYKHLLLESPPKRSSQYIRTQQVRASLEWHQKEGTTFNPNEYFEQGNYKYLYALNEVPSDRKKNKPYLKGYNREDREAICLAIQELLPLSSGAPKSLDQFTINHPTQHRPPYYPSTNNSYYNNTSYSAVQRERHDRSRSRHYRATPPRYAPYPTDYDYRREANSRNRNGREIRQGDRYREHDTRDRYYSIANNRHNWGEYNRDRGNSLGRNEPRRYDSRDGRYTQHNRY